jgi:glucose-1-phosphate cytidylyltransferase
LATVTGVRPPSRFGEFVCDGDRVTDFAEKPSGDARISGGFFVFQREVLERLSADPSCVLEREPLERLAADGELCVYSHDGFWQCADTVRDIELLRTLWDRGDAPWRIWDDRRRVEVPWAYEARSSGHPARRASDAAGALLGSVAR